MWRLGGHCDTVMLVKTTEEFVCGGSTSREMVQMWIWLLALCSIHIFDTEPIGASPREVAFYWCWQADNDDAMYCNEGYGPSFFSCGMWLFGSLAVWLLVVHRRDVASSFLSVNLPPCVFMWIGLLHCMIYSIVNLCSSVANVAYIYACCMQCNIK